MEDNVPVKKDQPLFQFDRRPYEYNVQQVEAQLAEAKQNVLVLQADVEVATHKAAKANVELEFEQYQKRIFGKLVQEQAVREEQIIQTDTNVNSAEATRAEALAELERARLRYKSEINGVNTSVVNLEAQLRQARYYLDNTTLTAPEDGRIINLQVRPGMVSGIYRIGGIAALIADADRLPARDLLPAEPEIRAAGTAGRGGARSLPRANFRRQSQGHLARQRRRTVSAERRDSEIPAVASQRSPRPVRGEDHPGGS